MNKQMVSFSISLLLIGSCSAMRLRMRKAAKDSPDHDEHLPLHENCKKLMTLIGESKDVKECQNDRSGDYVINNQCLSMKPGARVTPEFHANDDIQIGIVTVDDRDWHPAHKTWGAYAAKHGYTYIKAKPDAGTLLEKDWSSTKKMKEILEAPEYKHVTHFMYTEVDQWPTQPMAKLEPVFKRAGLVEKKYVMAVVGEYPCDNIRNGGIFNMGNYLFARDDRVVPLFNDWSNSGAFNFARSMSSGKANLTSIPHLDLIKYKGAMDLPRWPARQGAFSVDVYDKYKGLIYKFASGNPLGSPFGTLVGHCTSGTLEKTYDHFAARALYGMISKCVDRRLENDDAQPCSFYPDWVGSPCLTCRGSYEVKNEQGTNQYGYKGCCGEVDAALPLEAFKRHAEKGLLQPGSETDLHNMGIIDANLTALLKKPYYYPN